MSILRHPKTTQEKRMFEKAEFDEKEYGHRIKLRKCRSPRNLIDSWDDVFRWHSWQKNWKSYRKQRWK